VSGKLASIRPEPNAKPVFGATLTFSRACEHSDGSTTSDLWMTAGFEMGLPVDKSIIITERYCTYTWTLEVSETW